MNHKALPLMAVAFSLIGCDASNTSMVIEGVIPGEEDMMAGGCTFDPETDTFLERVSMDVSEQLTLFLNLKASNRFEVAEVTIDKDPTNKFTSAEDITPLRFDYRWECESIGFAPNLGPMFLPQFSVTQPFCLDNRDDTTRNFVGFDVISATGNAIPPGGSGAVQVRVVPAQLGLAINDMFGIAALAEQCCASTDGCGGVETGANTSCLDLAAYFDDIALPQDRTEAAQQYRPFALFDGQQPPTNVGLPTPFYTMRMRGVLEGVTSSGDIITSNEFAQDIGFGRNTTQGSSPCTKF